MARTNLTSESGDLPIAQSVDFHIVAICKGQKSESCEGACRVVAVIRWAGVIKQGTVFTEMFAYLDCLRTFVEIAH